MFITCLDVEGVLVPEIWVAFAKESGIPELIRFRAQKNFWMSCAPFPR